MKKLICAALGALMATASVNAQSLLENPDNRPYLGARVGLDITSTANSQMGVYTNGAGFNIGAIYNIPVYKNLYVEPGLSIFYDTFGEEVPEIKPGDASATTILNVSVRNFGFRIPLVAGYFFDFTDDIRVSPFTGPQLNVGLLAQQKLPGMDATSIFGEYGFKHLDLQWVFGVGLSWQCYYVNIMGGVGFTRIMDTKLEHYNRNTFSITLGYNF